jgi:hypothetical protein
MCCAMQCRTVRRVPQARQDHSANGARYSASCSARMSASWLSYTATLHRALVAPVTVLAVAVTEDMERWCARPYAYDHLGSTFRPLVLGPSSIPRITDVEQARALPELALLSVVAHGQKPGAEAIGIAAYLAAGCSKFTWNA